MVQPVALLRFLAVASGAGSESPQSIQSDLCRISVHMFGNRIRCDSSKKNMLIEVLKQRRGMQRQWKPNAWDVAAKRIQEMGCWDTLANHRRARRCIPGTCLSKTVKLRIESKTTQAWYASICVSWAV